MIRDGKVNPDVRTIPDSSDVMNMAQSVLYNAVSYVLQKNPTNSKNAGSFIDTFFLASSTAMNPNMNYGQLVRGPGKEHQIGTFTGILDMRAFVKVVNAIQLLRVTKSPDWTSAREQAMMSWTKRKNSGVEVVLRTHLLLRVHNCFSVRNESKLRVSLTLLPS